MIDAPQATASQTGPAPTDSRRGWLPFFAHFFRVAGVFWTSEHKWVACGLTAALIVLTLAMVAVQVALNLWTERLYDALSGRSIARFVTLLGALGAIVLANLTIVTTHLRLKRRLQITWRRWLTATVSGEWMSEAHHYQLTYMPGEHSNPDGRIAEDIRITCESALDLGHSLFYCTILLVSFANILWTLSGDPIFTFGVIEAHIPGHLVWAALVYAIIGSSVAVLLGRPLVRAVDRRQTSEASFRFGVARARENSLPIGLLHGEKAERRQFEQLFVDVVAAWNRQTAALANIFMFTSSWSVLLQVVPVLISAPRFIAGVITLGVLMQIAQAFQQTVGALSWPVDNLSQVAEWRASAERVLSLHSAVRSLVDSLKQGSTAMLNLREGPTRSLNFRQVSIADPDGSVAIGPFDLTIAAGERVLISGDTTGAIKLFKATAGLWPWGHGDIELPAGEPISFMPQQPYVPPGTLRDLICYPGGRNPCDDLAMADILRRVGLPDLVTRLDEAERWDQSLSADELQRLGFARLFMHRPRWAFLQDAMDALGADGEAEMLRLADAMLPGTTILSIANHDMQPDYYTRALTVVKHDGYSIVEEARPTRAVLPA
ncbi:MAG TPA: ABC transporter ATP-binding protein/permease [Alphaproteobacteria bacterium]|nr:ABC transporter ATP-binding protein/permease [Alphaproteobacteria bacterium]